MPTTLQFINSTRIQSESSVSLPTMHRKRHFQVSIRHRQRQDIMKQKRRDFEVYEDVNQAFHQYLEAYHQQTVVPQVCVIHFEALSCQHIREWIKKFNSHNTLTVSCASNIVFLTKISLSEKVLLRQFVEQSMQYAQRICHTIKCYPQKPEKPIAYQMSVYANSLIDFWSVYLTLENQQIKIKYLHIIQKSIRFWYENENVFGCLSKISFCRLFEILFKSNIISDCYSQCNSLRTANRPKKALMGQDLQAEELQQKLKSSETDNNHQSLQTKSFKILQESQKNIKLICQCVAKNLIKEKFICPQLLSLLLHMIQNSQFLLADKESQELQFFDYLISCLQFSDFNSKMDVLEDKSENYFKCKEFSEGKEDQIQKYIRFSIDQIYRQKTHQNFNQLTETITKALQIVEQTFLNQKSAVFITEKQFEEFLLTLISLLKRFRHESHKKCSTFELQCEILRVIYNSLLFLIESDEAYEHSIEPSEDSSGEFKNLYPTFFQRATNQSSSNQRVRIFNRTDMWVEHLVKQIDWADFIQSSNCENEEILLLVVEILALGQELSSTSHNFFVQQVFADGRLFETLSDFISLKSQDIDKQQLDLLSHNMFSLLENAVSNSSQTLQDPETQQATEKSKFEIIENLERLNLKIESFCLPTEVEDLGKAVVRKLRENGNAERYWGSGDYEQIEI